MAIKSVWIEEDCIACGTCEGICPEVFQVTDRSRVNEGVNFNDYEEGIKEAAESCPVRHQIRLRSFLIQHLINYYSTTYSFLPEETFVSSAGNCSSLRRKL